MKNIKLQPKLTTQCTHMIKTDTNSLTSYSSETKQSKTKGSKRIGDTHKRIDDYTHSNDTCMASHTNVIAKTLTKLTCI